MAKHQNVISMARVRISKDPAVLAWLKVRTAGEDDVAYDFAIDIFERAVPTTKLGLWLKQRLLRQRDEALREGDTLTDEGLVMYARYRETLKVRVV